MKEGKLHIIISGQSAKDRKSGTARIFSTAVPLYGVLETDSYFLFFAGARR